MENYTLLKYSALENMYCDWKVQNLEADMTLPCIKSRKLNRIDFN